MKRYQTVILVFIFVLTLFSSFHTHDDGYTDEDCQVCILQHNLVSGDISHNISLESPELYFDIPVYTSQFLIIETSGSFNSRAPPSFS